jgi:parallel beta-helix repeat protein
VVCLVAGTYTGNLSATVANQTWRLDPATRLTGTIYINGSGVRLLGGRIELPAANRWAASVAVWGNDVTVQGVTFRGGGVGVGVYGRDRTSIVSNDFAGHVGSAVSIWSEGLGADDTLISGNKIVQTATFQVSPITSRGNEGSLHGGIQNARTVIRNNTINQGSGDIGWFGIELKQSKGTLIEGNTLSGGYVLVSLPESDATTIRNNTFDMRGTPHWGVEVANAYDAIVENNTFIGGGTTAGDHAVSLNTGSLRTTARYNTVRDLRTFFDVSGNWHTVTDNCFTSVANEYEYRSSGGANITFARNGAC